MLEEQTHTEIAKQLTYHQDNKPSFIHTEAEQDHSPSHRLNQVSQTSASLVMFDAQNDNQNTEKFHTGLGSYYFGAGLLATGGHELHLTNENSSIGNISDRNHKSIKRTSDPTQ